MRSDLVDIEVTVHTQTTKMIGDEDRGAYLIESEVSAPKRTWIPKSMCEVGEIDYPSKRATLTAPESFLTEKGLV